MNFKLNVITRLLLFNNMPENGSIEEMINKRNVRDKITFSSEELDKLQLKTNENGITFQPIDDLEVEFTNTEIKFLNDVMEKISEKGLFVEASLDFVLYLREELKEE